MCQILFISGSNVSNGQIVAPQMLASTCCNLEISSYLLCFGCNICIYSYGDLYKSAVQELNEDTEKNFSDRDDDDDDDKSEEMKYIINWSLV